MNHIVIDTFTSANTRSGSDRPMNPSIGRLNMHASNTRNLVVLGTLAIAMTFAGITNAATIPSVTNGNLIDSSTWSGSPAVPTSGTSDTNTWQIVHNVTRDAASTFAGQILEVGSGSNDGTLRLEGGSATLTVRDLVLNTDGTIFQDKDTNTLAGDTMTLNGGRFSIDRDGKLNVNFETYDGSGTVAFYGNNANADPATLFQTSNSTPGTAMQGFTGTLYVDVLNGSGGSIGFNFDITAASFGIKLADTDSCCEGASDTLGTNGKLRLNDDVDITVTDVHLYDEASDGSIVLDVHLAPGTYTLNTGVNPGAIDLTNVGGNDYSRFFTGGSGTVTIGSSGPVIPAPAALPGGLALMGVMLVARRRSTTLTTDRRA